MYLSVAPCFRRALMRLVASLLLLASSIPNANSATVVIHTNISGLTPSLLSYNAAHFLPGSNTRDWWRYSGVTGARVFVAPSEIEASDDIAGRGDGVTNQTQFLARRDALRANPLNLAYINWTYFTNRYETRILSGANSLRINYAFSQMRSLGMDIMVNITASQNFLTITDANDWAGKWELWQHYYAQAFYLAREFEVKRFQMYNEPNHSNADGLTISDYLQRLKLASDAIQCALADVNTLYSKSLAPNIMAPTTAGSDSVYSTWGRAVITNRHVNFLGVSDTNFNLVHSYSYQEYNDPPSGFAADASALINLMTADMAPEPPLPLAISEWNVHTAATFDGMVETLDSTSKYPRFGAIAGRLVASNVRELFAFKFGQTDGDVGDAYPIRKNGMHYVDNDATPFNTGGITKAGEVWRLFNKAMKPGRVQMGFTADAALNNLTFRSSYNPATGVYYLFSANDSGSSASLTVDVSALGIPNNNRVTIEEVSETHYGSVKQFTRVLNGLVTTFTQPANSVWLFSIPSKPQYFVTPGVPTLLVPAVADATVKDGTNKFTGFGSLTNLVIRNDTNNAADRSAALIKFALPTVYLPDVQFAVLTLNASTMSTNTAVQAHLYGLNSDSWSQSSVNWFTAPGLRQNIAVGNRIPQNVIASQGSTTLLQGQVVCSSTNPTEIHIDVTEFIRTQTNSEASFIISQDPRWNLTLPSRASGDTQPDGIRIVSSEGAGTFDGPQLRFVRLQDSDSDGISDEAEATTFATSPTTPDTDNDGLNDGAEILTHKTNPLAVDSDSDGATDNHEIIAGTNPLNPSSYLHFNSVQLNPVTLHFEWSAVTNRTYHLLRSVSLIAPDWQEIHSAPGTNSIMTYDETLSPAELLLRPSAFYRIRVEP